MTPTFDKVFDETIKRLEAEAKEVGLTFTSICRDTGISRATPDRWRKDMPETVKIVAKMQNVVSERRAQLEKEKASALHHD